MRRLGLRMTEHRRPADAACIRRNLAAFRSPSRANTHRPAALGLGRWHARFCLISAPGISRLFDVPSGIPLRACGKFTHGNWHEERL